MKLMTNQSMFFDVFAACALRLCIVVAMFVVFLFPCRFFPLSRSLSRLNANDSASKNRKQGQKHQVWPETEAST